MNKVIAVWRKKHNIKAAHHSVVQKEENHGLSWKMFAAGWLQIKRLKSLPWTKRTTRLRGMDPSFGHFFAICPNTSFSRSLSVHPPWAWSNLPGASHRHLWKLMWVCEVLAQRNMKRPPPLPCVQAPAPPQILRKWRRGRLGLSHVKF